MRSSTSPQITRSCSRKLSRVWLIAPSVEFSTGTTPKCTAPAATSRRSEEHTSELQSRPHLVCRLLLEKKNNTNKYIPFISSIEDAMPHAMGHWSANDHTGTNDQLHTRN